MRVFKKDGNLKPKKSDDSKYIETLLANGWTEVIAAPPKPKEKKKSK